MNGPLRRRGGAARAIAIVVLALVGLPLVSSAPAYAHASMVGSSPEQGDVLDALPDQVDFEFSEPMDPTAYVAVTAPDGSALTVGEPEVDGSTVTQEIGAGGDGTYLMAIKAVSRDGHPVSGRVEFVVGEPSETGTAEAPSGQPSVDTDSPTTSASDVGATDQGHDTGWRGRDPWVWWVGPGFLGLAGALWLAGRRTTQT